MKIQQQRQASNGQACSHVGKAFVDVKTASVLCTANARVNAWVTKMCGSPKRDGNFISNVTASW
jgi:hypothetical protein